MTNNTIFLDGNNFDREFINNIPIRIIECMFWLKERYPGLKSIQDIKCLRNYLTIGNKEANINWPKINYCRSKYAFGSRARCIVVTNYFDNLK